MWHWSNDITVRLKFDFSTTCKLFGNKFVLYINVLKYFASIYKGLIMIHEIVDSIKNVCAGHILKSEYRKICDIQFLKIYIIYKLWDLSHLNKDFINLNNEFKINLCSLDLKCLFWDLHQNCVIKYLQHFVNKFSLIHFLTKIKFEIKL